MSKCYNCGNYYEGYACTTCAQTQALKKTADIAQSQFEFIQLKAKEQQDAARAAEREAAAAEREAAEQAHRRQLAINTSFAIRAVQDFQKEFGEDISIRNYCNLYLGFENFTTRDRWEEFFQKAFSINFSDNQKTLVKLYSEAIKLNSKNPYNKYKAEWYVKQREILKNKEKNGENKKIIIIFTAAIGVAGAFYINTSDWWLIIRMAAAFIGFSLGGILTNFFYNDNAYEWAAAIYKEDYERRERKDELIFAPFSNRRIQGIEFATAVLEQKQYLLPEMMKQWSKSEYIFSKNDLVEEINEISNYIKRAESEYKSIYSEDAVDMATADQTSSAAVKYHEIRQVKANDILRFCSDCGAQGDSSTVFCSECGKKQA